MLLHYCSYDYSLLPQLPYFHYSHSSLHFNYFPLLSLVDFCIDLLLSLCFFFYLEFYLFALPHACSEADASAQSTVHTDTCEYAIIDTYTDTGLYL